VSWELIILLIFLTPLGWIGLICFGLAIGIIFQGMRGGLK
jgi:hypothetical protein